MKVLVVAGEWFPDRESGFARVVTDTARWLAQRGHVVSALVPAAEGLPAETTEGSLTIRRAIARNALPQTFTDVYQTAKRARNGDGGDYDVVLAHEPGTVVGATRALPRTPIVQVFHAPHSRELRFDRAHLRRGRERIANLALESAFVLLERAAMRRSNRILALSDFSRSLIEEDHPAASARIRRVWGGVDVQRFSPADGQAAARKRLELRPDGQLIVTVRRLEPRMGIDRLLQAVRVLRMEQDVPVELAVVGGGPLERPLRQLAESLGVGSAVRFTGRVDDDELPDWYRAADLFVLPTVAYEGFGMVTAEALATGTPVVGTPIGATPELIAPLDPTFVAAAAEAGPLAAAIAAALRRTGSELSASCRTYAVARFGWDRTIEGWEAALGEVCTSRA